MTPRNYDNHRENEKFVMPQTTMVSKTTMMTPENGIYNYIGGVELEKMLENEEENNKENSFLVIKTGRDRERIACKSSISHFIIFI